MFSSTHEFHFRVRVEFEFYSFLDFKLEYFRVAKNCFERVEFSSFELLDHALIAKHFNLAATLRYRVQLKACLLVFE